MARALRSRASFRSGGSLRAWLRKTALRAFIDSAERRRRHPEDLGDRDGSVPGPPGRDPGATEELESLLRRLTPLERDVLLRFHGEHESVAAIGQALDLPEGTVKSHLHRARRKLVDQGSGGPS